MSNKLGCTSVKLHVWLEFLKVLSDLTYFGWWLTMLEILVAILLKVGDHFIDDG